MSNYVNNGSFKGQSARFCEKHGCNINKCRKQHGDFSRTAFREAMAYHLAEAIREMLEDMTRV